MTAYEQEMLAKADAWLAQDKDHLTDPDGRDLAWLIAQLSCWPERVDEACTTNHRFLLMSAAAVLRNRLTSSAREAA